MCVKVAVEFYDIDVVQLCEVRAGQQMAALQFHEMGDAQLYMLGAIQLCQMGYVELYDADAEQF